jgi:hypothetical protein
MVHTVLGEQPGSSDEDRFLLGGNMIGNVGSGNLGHISLTPG